MPSNKKVQNTTQKNTNSEPALPKDLKQKIINFKEVLPQYKQCTNDDIIAIFEEYNNDYEAAVYGAMNGLSTNKPTSGWQNVGQKKKKKTKGQRGQSSNYKNSRTGNTTNDSSDNRGRKGNSRGHSSTRGSSNRSDSSRGRNASSSNSRQPSAPPSWSQKNNVPASSQPISQPPRVQAAPTSSVPVNQPMQQAPMQQTMQQAPIQQTVQKPTSVTQNTGGRLSYANVARSRQAWNPNANKSAPQSTKNENVQPNEPNVPQAVEKPVQQTQQAAPVAPPQNVQSVPVSASLPSQSFSQPQSTTSNVAAVQKPQAQTQDPSVNIPKAEKPRVGVLLPGNFASEDSMSFQFGNLGMLDDDLGAGSSRPAESEIPKTQQQPSQSIPSGNPPRQSDQQNTATKANEGASSQHEQEQGQGFPMHNFPQGYPMYPMESGDPRGPPMAYFPDSYAYSRDGKYRGGNSQNASAGRGEGNSKFSSDSASGAQAPAGQPFPYGYPLYPPYQFPGGSYGNQFYGYGYNPKFPGYSQSYANSAMSYTPEDEYKHRMPGQYYQQGQEQTSSAPRDSKSGSQTSGSQGKQSSSSQGKSSASNASANAGSSANGAGVPPGMEGNFQQGDFKNSPSADFYSGMEYNSSFMSPPFFHPAQQPQQPGSRNY